MSEHDDFWKRVDEFYKKHPETAEAEYTGERWKGIEAVLEKLVEDYEQEKDSPPRPGA